MSTRSTVWYQKPTDDVLDMHLYAELYEDGALFLEIQEGPFLCNFRLPLGLLKAIKSIDLEGRDLVGSVAAE